MSKNLKIFADIIEPQAVTQINEFMASSVAEDAYVRIMPDVHAGKGCVVGFTCAYEEMPKHIIPNIIGVDIGCGMMAYPLEDVEDLNLRNLEIFIVQKIPFGMKIHEKKSWSTIGVNTQKWNEVREKAKKLTWQLKCWLSLKRRENFYWALGSLGGGNHFIEIDKDISGKHWLIVHSGSRNLGLQVAEHYQRLAKKDSGLKEQIDRTISALKEMHREHEINASIAKIKSVNSQKMKNPDLAFISGTDVDNYIHDQNLCVQWAQLNRELIVRFVVEKFYKLKFNKDKAINSIHNYIGKDCIIRKGSCSAYDGDYVIIPMNMRDGTLLCKGKGNGEWNYSAPHGAGRLMSRTEAFKKLSVDEFKETMKDVTSWSVGKETLDESPMAYKPMENIINQIKDTVEVVDIWKPIYNFKAPSEEPLWKKTK